MRNNLGSSLFNSWVGTHSRQRIYEFDDFRLDAGHLILSRKEKEISLPPRAVETLIALIERPGEVVSKDELLNTVWPDTIVDESNLFAYLSQVRKALGNRKDGKPYVETLRRRGYRFICEVKLVAEPRAGNASGTFHLPTSQKPLNTPTRSSTNGARVVALAEWMRDVPDEGESEVDKALDDGSRSSSSSSTTLRRRLLLTATSLGILILVLSGLYLWKVNSQAKSAPVPSVAILPFLPLVPASRDESFEFGMAEALIRKVNSTGEIIARPLSSVREFTAEDRDPLTIGRKLGVDYVLDGYIQVLEGKKGVSVRLTSTTDGRQIWEDAFSEESTDIFDVQDKIAGRIAGTLRPQLTERGKVLLTKHGTVNREAYNRYHLARYHLARATRPEAEKGIAYLKQAIDLDPNYALAYAELSYAYRGLILGGDTSASEAFPKQKEAALKALDLDNTLAEAHVMAGHVAMQERNWEEAERRAHHALELEPTNTPAAFLLEHIYSYQGRHDQAVLMAERTHELDPVSPIYNSVEAQTLLYAGQVEDALQKALTARDHDENFWHVHFMLARIYAEKDMYKEAIVAADRAEQPSADHSYVLAVKGYALARSGAEVEARAIVDQLLERTQSARPNTHAALVYTGLGDKQKALEHLEIGFENGELQFDLKAAPAWDDLRSEPRFIELLRKWRLD